MSEDKDRFNVEIPSSLNERLKRQIPWGLKNSVVICILDRLATKLEEHGKVVLVDIMDGNFDLVTKGTVVQILNTSGDGDDSAA